LKELFRKIETFSTEDSCSHQIRGGSAIEKLLYDVRFKRVSSFKAERSQVNTLRKTSQNLEEGSMDSFLITKLSREGSLPIPSLKPILKKPSLTGLIDLVEN